MLTKTITESKASTFSLEESGIKFTITDSKDGLHLAIDNNKPLSISVSGDLKLESISGNIHINTLNGNLLLNCDPDKVMEEEPKRICNDGECSCHQ